MMCGATRRLVDEFSWEVATVVDAAIHRHKLVNCRLIPMLRVENNLYNAYDVLNSFIAFLSFVTTYLTLGLCNDVFSMMTAKERT